MSSSKGASTVIEDNDRSKAAKELFLKLKNSSANLNDIAVKTNKMSLALIDLAYTQIPKSKPLKIPTNHSLLRLNNMEKILLPTHNLPIDKSGDYASSTHFVGITRFEANYSMVGGINAPKKMSCLGTDGKVRPQLLKGKLAYVEKIVLLILFRFVFNLQERTI